LYCTADDDDDDDDDASVEWFDAGEKCEFVVDTSTAGCGALAVTVDGPSKVHLDCQQLPGPTGTGGTGTTGSGCYEFSYRPSAVGQYSVSVKYAGDHHVTGSPFHVNVTGLLSSSLVLLLK